MKEEEEGERQRTKESIHDKGWKKHPDHFVIFDFPVETPLIN